MARIRKFCKKNYNMEFNQILNWRYATKRMTGAKMTDTQLRNILHAIPVTLKNKKI